MNNWFFIFNDAFQPFDLGFQDSAAPGFSGIIGLHITLIFILPMVILSIKYHLKKFTIFNIISGIFILFFCISLILGFYFFIQEIQLEFLINYLVYSYTVMSLMVGMLRYYMPFAKALIWMVDSADEERLTQSVETLQGVLADADSETSAGDKHVPVLM